MGARFGPAARQCPNCSHGRTLEDLPQQLTFREKLPVAAATKAHNRYLNILPNPETRVKLEVTEDAPAADYINANYVPNFDGKNPRKYIATQGPLDSTIGAFWRMIWEQRCGTIVMATNIMENGLAKCARYWPTVRYNEQKRLGDKVYDGISVAVITGDQCPGIVKTTLRLRKGAETRTIKHFWYTDWPDHGVPANVHNALAMMLQMSAHNDENFQYSPIVVHCSAGIGRTGTLILIDQCMEALHATARVDVIEMVHRLRAARGGMVQHAQQYEFALRACVEYAKLSEIPYQLMPVNNAAKRPSMCATSQSTQLAAIIAHGKTPEMTDAEWNKLLLTYEKQQAAIRAKTSTRRRMDEAELHGELRLGTISKMAARRPTMAGLFPTSE